MAVFRVGQRVRVIWCETNGTAVRLGMTGTIIAAVNVRMLIGWMAEWDVNLDALTRHGPYFFRSEHLAPLTDPRAEAFLDRIRDMDAWAALARFITTEEGVFERRGDTVKKVSR